MRKVFISRDQQGYPISVDSVAKEDVIFDSFGIEDETYRIVTRPFVGSLQTRWKSIPITKMENGQEKETSATQFASFLSGMFEHVVITLTDREEIEDAWAWLHPGTPCPAWEMINEKNKRMAKFQEFKKDPRNYTEYNNHVKEITEWLSRKNYRETATILEDAHARYVKKQRVEMEELQFN